MIRRLRRQFVVITVLSMFAVLALLTTVINVQSWRVQKHEEERMMLTIAVNGGELPEPLSRGDLRYLQLGDRLSTSAEAAYALRYFSVELKPDGALRALHMDHIVTVRPETATDMAREAFQSGKQTGSKRTLRWLRWDLEDGGALIVFLLCAERFGFQTLLLVSSAGTVVIGMGLVVLLVLWLSGRAMRPAEESVRRQKQFITDAGHELRTPLTIIAADTEVLSYQGGNEWLDSIRSQTQRMGELVSDLVELSRLGEDDSALDLSLYRLCISDTARETAESFRSYALTRNIRFEVRVEPELYMMGSEDMLRKLCSLLLDNAIKYCDEGGEVLLSLKGGRRLTLEVENDCAETETPELDRIFDRFYRADPARTSSGSGGFGLGLAVAQAIVKTCGGHIDARMKAPGRIVFTASFDAV